MAPVSSVDNRRAVEALLVVLSVIVGCKDVIKHDRTGGS
jgi:hypothetical protein